MALPEPFIDAYRDVSQLFQKMLDALSALREMSSLSVRQESEPGLLNRALQILLKHQDMDHVAFFLSQGDQITLSGQLGRDALGQLAIMQSSELKPLLKEVLARGESRRIDANQDNEHETLPEIEGRLS